MSTLGQCRSAKGHTNLSTAPYLTSNKTRPKQTTWLPNTPRFIDRYTGDSVMGVFPGGASDALQAVRDTMSSLHAFNVERQKLGLEAIRIGIGLHIGSLRLGIVGEHQRRQGDIFADAVNVASRIEGLTKTFGTSVIVSDSLLRALENADVELPLRRTLGRVLVKGRLEPVTLHEAFEFDRPELVDHKRDSRQAFDSFHLHFEAKRYAEAKASLAPVIAAQEGDLAARYLVDLATDQIQDGNDGGR